MLNILIIDDDEDDSDLLREAILQVRPRTHCFIAHSAIDAMQSLNQNEFPRPDLIFLDLNMPNVNGVQCLRELKRDSKLSSIPVVVYTSSKSSDEQAAMLKLGAGHFIIKPASFRQICKVISNILAQEIDDDG